MQKNERVLTWRCDNSKLDEATKVFKVCEAEVDDKYKLVFHDFGGQAIYQFAYQLSDRSQYIPMLVIDIAHARRHASSMECSDAAPHSQHMWPSICCAMYNHALQVMRLAMVMQ